MKTINVADNPAVIKARAKLAELQSQLTAAKNDLEQAHAVSNDKADAMSAKVAALVDGRDVATTAVPNTAELRERMRLFHAACDVQKRHVLSAEHDAGVAIAKQMEGEHSTLLADLAKAVAALRSAAEKYFAFCCRLNDAGAKPETVFSLMPFIGQITRDAPTWLANAWLDRLAATYPKLSRGLA